MKGSKASILPQPNFGGCRDLVFAIRENGTGPHTCYKEVTTLFSSSHDRVIDRVPFAVTIKEVGFHREDSEVGDKIGDV